MDVLRFEEILRACIRCGVKVGADDLQASTDRRGRRWHAYIFRARKYSRGGIHFAARAESALASIEACAVRIRAADAEVGARW